MFGMIKREHLAFCGFILAVVLAITLQQHLLEWLLGAGVAGIFTADFGTYFSGQEAAKSANRDRNQNWRMYRNSRGYNGNAVLPWYLPKDEAGNTFEERWGGDVVDAYDAVPVTSVESYQSDVDRTSGMRDAARTTAGNIFNGGITKTMEANAAPVQAIRSEAPTMTKQASVAALSKTLNAISAAQARRGFQGDGLAKARLTYDVTRDNNTEVADAVLAAKMANAEETRGIRNYGDVELPLKNLSLPGQIAREDIAMRDAASNAYIDAASRRALLLNPLRGFDQPFQFQPTVNAPSAWGAALDGLGVTAGTVTNSILKNIEANRIREAQQRQQFNNNASAYMGANTQYGGGGWSTNGNYMGDINQPTYQSAPAYAPQDYYSPESYQTDRKSVV